MSSITSEFIKLKQELDKANAVALISHINPDADSLGSICALAAALEIYYSINNKSVSVKCFTKGPIPTSLMFLPGLDQVAESPTASFSADLYIICDCGDMKRPGELLFEWVKNSGQPVINLDHHASNDNFGDINIVEPLSSTSELIYLLLEQLQVDLNPQIATLLLAGIIGDTGCFRYRSASAETLERAAQLVKAGADLSDLAEKLYGSVPMSTVKLESYALQNMKVSLCGRVAGVVVGEDIYKNLNASSSDGEMLAETIRDIEGIICSYSIRWLEKGWKVSLRTSSTDVDLTKVATRFGGGGHRAAAAFRFSEKPELMAAELEKSLVALLEEI